MKKLSFSQKLKICWLYPTLYLFITIFTNVFVHFHSNYLADEGFKVSRSSYNYTLSHFVKVQYHFAMSNIDFKSWASENGEHFRSIFAFNEHTEYYFKSYNDIEGLENIKIFDILEDIGKSTMRSSFSNLYEIVLGRNFLQYTPFYSFIFFVILFSAMIRHWQFLSFLEKNGTMKSPVTTIDNEAKVSMIEKKAAVKSPVTTTDDNASFSTTANKKELKTVYKEIGSETKEAKRGPVIDPNFT
jgi:hypothetical protein